MAQNHNVDHHTCNIAVTVWLECNWSAPHVSSALVVIVHLNCPKMSISSFWNWLGNLVMSHVLHSFWIWNNQLKINLLKIWILHFWETFLKPIWSWKKQLVEYNMFRLKIPRCFTFWQVTNDEKYVGLECKLMDLKFQDWLLL